MNLAGKKILITPLDWGLGHTTRCLSLIEYFTNLGATVLVGTSGVGTTVIQSNFPHITILPLEGYNVTYPNNPKWLILKLISQIPRLLGVIKREKKWLAQIVDELSIDYIISDNRYGMYHPKVTSVFLTHQVQILSNWNPLVDNFLLKAHQTFMRPFNKIWIVDQTEPHGLAGILSHPTQLPPHSRYIGWLSQFQLASFQNIVKKDIIKNKIVVLLSGLEPTRTQLSNLILEQISAMKEYQFVFIAGTPHKINGPTIDIPNHIQYIDYANADTIYTEMLDAALVICRSGYSTVMDLTILNKKALLIPTPGQTEQEYLSEYLSNNKIFMTVNQSDLQLKIQIPQALQQHSTLSTTYRNNLLTDAIKDILI